MSVTLRPSASSSSTSISMPRVRRAPALLEADRRRAPEGDTSMRVERTLTAAQPSSVRLPLAANEPPSVTAPPPASAPLPMVPNAGLWGDYMTPVGDGFTGTRNGVNYFRGHVWAAEGLAQGGGTGTVQSYAFAQWLRHHLPMLLGSQGQNASVSADERARLGGLLLELGGPV